MENQNSPDLSDDQKRNWLGLLFQKQAYVESVRHETGKQVDSALKEVDRQRNQVINHNTITKSGGGD